MFVLLLDAFALGLVMIAALFVSASFDGPAVQEIRWATFATLGAAPLVFLAALLNVRLARSAATWSSSSEPTPSRRPSRLARPALRSSLELAYWLPDFGVYVDLDGKPVELPELNGRSTTLIDRHGGHVAALIHDPALDDEPELLEGVEAAAGISLENARLDAELRARLEELRGSRARIVEAAQSERQLLERNLHDGAQQRLIALSLELSMLKGRVDGDLDVKAGIDRARREIAASLAELREIARGLHPAVVSGHGLAVALEQLVARPGAGGAEGRRQGRLPSSSRLPRTTSSRKPRECRQARTGGRGVVECSRRRVSWWWRSWTTASAEPTVSEARHPRSRGSGRGAQRAPARLDAARRRYP